MIAQSQSGTGKTAAFVLSMLSRVDATKNFSQVKMFKIIDSDIIMLITHSKLITRLGSPVGRWDRSRF